MAAAEPGKECQQASQDRGIETAEMLVREKRAVEILRGDGTCENRKTKGPWLGLALSGGGIRSASFAMGVMQGLQAWDVMRKFDYLSTVSGGGYIGSSLSYFLVQHARNKPGDREFWFPFGRKGQAGARGDNPRSTTGDDDPVEIVSFIRQHAHYLTPAPKLGIFALVANALRAVLFSLSIYFAVLVLLMALVFDSGRIAPYLAREVVDFAPIDGCACTLGAPAKAAPAPQTVCLPVCGTPSSGVSACIPVAAQPPACAAQATGGCEFHWWSLLFLPCVQHGNEITPGGLNVFAILGLLALGFAGLSTLIYSVGSYVAGVPRAHDDKDRPIRVYYSSFTIPLTATLGILLKVQIVGLALGSLPWAFGWAEQHSDGNLIGAISVAVAYIGTWREKHKVMLGKLAESSLWKSIWPYLYSVLAIYGILFLAYGVSEQVPDPFGPQKGWFLALVGATIFFGVFTNLNLVSQHRMYRDRLMEALCPDSEYVKRGEWGPAKVADAMQMSRLAGGARSGVDNKNIKPIHVVGPYHLVNTALIIPDSRQPKYSGRGADSFVLSPLFCGSDASKWAESVRYMGDRMMLPTAMAISGAALNAHSGPDGKGVLRTPLVSFLLTLFGVQLGYWAPNPGRPKQWQQKANYLRPGLDGLIGFRMNESGRFVQLSDGGHFENLGLYELIRRKLDLIVVSDGGQDGEFSFADLGNAIERVRVDFGVSIHFDDPDFTLEGVLPQQREALSDTWSKKFGLAKRGFAFASIIYPDRPPHECGVLIYIKATMIEKLPSDLYAYKAENPEFPDQSTLDQFFDEDQFEAYRELGYRLTKQMTMTLSSELVHKWPVTRRLAKERLDPKPPEQPR
jgi:hypothetical protein